MTKHEMAEVDDLRGQIVELQLQQESQTRRLLRWERIGLCAAAALGTAAAYTGFALPQATMSISSALSLTMVPLLALSLAINNTAQPAQKRANARNFVIWVIILLVLLAFFTLLNGFKIL
jgi:hypothetical protein